MTKIAKEVLEKAIQKAIDGGYGEEQPDTLLNEILTPHDGWNVYDLIFSHDFAKALFGDFPVHNMGGAAGYVTNWQYHLQRMVIADDSIKYLEENI